MRTSVSGESGGISADPLSPLWASLWLVEEDSMRPKGSAFSRMTINPDLAGFLLNEISHLSPFSSWHGSL